MTERMGSLAAALAGMRSTSRWTRRADADAGPGAARSRRWSRGLPCFYHRLCCRILGFAVEADRRRRPCGPPMLFVANHTSYLDIAVLGGLIDGSFMAKSEIASWPFFGWLAKLQRSVFVDRRARSTAQQRDAIAERLDGRRRADPVSRRHQRRRQSRAAVQERALRVAESSTARRAVRRAAGLDRLYPPRRHADRAASTARSSPGTATWTWCRISGPCWAWAPSSVGVEFHPPVTIDASSARARRSRSIARIARDFGGRLRRRSPDASRATMPRRSPAPASARDGRETDDPSEPRGEEALHQDLRLPDERLRFRAHGGRAGAAGLCADADAPRTPTW